MNNKIFRVLKNDLNYILHSSSNTTIDNNGNLFQFDLIDVNGYIPANDDENNYGVPLPFSVFSNASKNRSCNVMPYTKHGSW